jgi:hypothetical protein
MQTFNFIRSPNSCHYRLFEISLKKSWKFNTFSIILAIHILVFILLMKQNHVAISELAQRVNEVKIIEISLGTLLEKAKDKDASTKILNETIPPKINSGLKHQNQSDGTIKANIVKESAAPLPLENPVQITQLKLDSVPLTTLPIINDLIQFDINSKIRNSSVSNANEELGKELRIGELNNIIEILQLGSSKAVYSIPDFLNQNEKLTFRVEVGDFPDMETAIVNHLISHIRNSYPTHIFWNSKVKGRLVKLSMLPKDHAALEKFLRTDIFVENHGKDYSFWDKSKF